MTYPPPPGMPGDPGQQPMPDPYAPGGGYGPPPGDPYGTPPPTSDPYGQPPMSDPYGQPPQDPYGQPPQDLYGQPPMTGAPMSPGAPGMAPDPYGQPPMGGMPGQPPSFLNGQPPQQKSNLGWILGGVGGAAVLIILVVVGIVMFNSNDSSDNAGGGDKSTEENSGGEESGGEDGEDGGGEGGTYKVTDGMCTKLDVSKVPSSLGISEFKDITIDNEMYCSATSSKDAVVTVKATAFADAKEAEAGYKEYKNSEFVGGDGLVEFTGDWQKGEISQYSSLEGTASVFILDGNMAMTMFISSTSGSTNDEAKEAAVVFAEETFKIASS